jgi:hypothetical protein
MKTFSLIWHLHEQVLILRTIFSRFLYLPPHPCLCIHHGKVCASLWPQRWRRHNQRWSLYHPRPSLHWANPQPYGRHFTTRARKLHANKFAIVCLFQETTSASTTLISPWGRPHPLGSDSGLDMVLWVSRCNARDMGRGSSGTTVDIVKLQNQVHVNDTAERGAAGHGKKKTQWA